MMNEVWIRGKGIVTKPRSKKAKQTPHNDFWKEFKDELIKAGEPFKIYPAVDKNRNFGNWCKINDPRESSWQRDAFLAIDTNSQKKEVFVSIYIPQHKGFYYTLKHNAKKYEDIIGSSLEWIDDKGVYCTGSTRIKDKIYKIEPGVIKIIIERVKKFLDAFGRDLEPFLKEPDERDKLTPYLKWKIMERDSFTCQNPKCKKVCPKGAGLHVDHIIPVAKGGKLDEKNLQALCRDCNLKKGAGSL